MTSMFLHRDVQNIKASLHQAIVTLYHESPFSPTIRELRLCLLAVERLESSLLAAASSKTPSRAQDSWCHDSE